MNKTIYVEIGQTSGGDPVTIPLGCTSNFLESYVNKFSTSDQTDILCITEFLLQKFEGRDNESLEAESNRNIFKILFERFLSGAFEDHLKTKNLPTSAARVIYGQNLCHVAYHD